ncbi:phage tail tape measure protein [Tepidimicrobium xylanilyticum]|uniref:hypothetical protein n=1 Tax=Tepidimicrobium xylanilyticum TaxID=1123352 RepID=UPI0026502DCD|nr:hypothetical protein [Tepidimicrobium xylanilyticum]GMG96859.1 hypothetical protein EN5CB1_16850 [Tepidimicrobium xylanilyticum]
MAKSNFIVRGGADFSGIKNEIDKTEKNLKGFAGRINNTLSGISQGLGINLGKLTKVGLIAAATKKLVDFGKASIDVAADMREVQNVVDVTFGSMAKDIDDFAAESVKAYGLSTLAAKRHASTMGAMLKSSGIAGEAVRDMSIDLTKLSADMASFYNLDNDVAFQKIMSGMSGMTQPLKELGINMNIANVEAFALSQGFNKAWREMSQAEQTMWRYKYLLHVTKDAQGDFAREIGTWSNQVKILKMQWEEFMSLIGKVLVEILLPVVRFLNKALELLIKITKTIGKIYTMITGKEIVAETNMDIEDSALGAAEGEEKLADGIGKAAKAAKGALAPFDELNILQQNLATGGSGGLGGGVMPITSQINTKIDTRQVDDGIEETKRKWEGFFIWFGDWWNRLKQAFAIPIYVPAPIFAAIPDPIYEPNWGLELPPIEKPVFQPIPNPVYEPVWNLIPPPVPAVDYSQYATSLEKMKTKTAEITEGIRSLTVAGYEKMKQGALEHTEKLRQGQSELWEKVRVDTETVTGKIQTGLSTAWSTVETNFKTHKENVGKIAGEISTALVGNINQGLSTIGANFNKTIETVQTNLQTFGKNVATSAAETARTFTNNLSEGFKATVSNFATFANSVGRNLQTFGSGFLKASAETARGFVDNMVSGFSTVWNNFKNLMSSLGERVSGWFRENRSVITKTAIAAGIVIGGVGLALAAPAAIPYVTGALGGLASIPALAEGGITNGPTLALIGDNPGGREVVSPLDDLMAMIQTAVNEAGNSGGDLYLTVKVGEDTLTEKVISNINRQNRIAGATVIRV